MYDLIFLNAKLEWQVASTHATEQEARIAMKIRLRNSADPHRIQKREENEANQAGNKVQFDN